MCMVEFECYSEDITINVGNAPLEQVSVYKYLGMWIDKKNVE